MFWRKLRSKRWWLISKSQHILCLIRAAPWNWLTSSWRHPLITWSPFNPCFIFSLRLLQKPNIAVIGQTKKRWHSFLLQTTLVTRVGKKSFYKHFAPPHPSAMLTKHFHLTQVCILPFSNIERGNWSVDTNSVSITIIIIMISCFWHFPTQFVQGCRFTACNMSFCTHSSAVSVEWCFR